MFYDETKTINACEQDPSLIFELLKEGHVSLIDKILSRKTFDINVTDNEGNDILTRLLKKGQYEIVLKHIKDKRWDINHQNNDGDTFAHILFSLKNYIILDIFKELKKNKRFTPNITNNFGETILDKSLKNSSTYTTAKILEDNRFNEIGVFTFKKLFDTYIKSKDYGEYMKLNNLEMIIGNLKDREVSPKVKDIINYLKDNYEMVKEQIVSNKTKGIDNYMKEVLLA